MTMAQLAQAGIDPDELATLLANIMLDRWSGGVFMRGQLPVIPTRTALPAASAAYRGCLIAVLGAVGATDTFYVCLKSAADTYAWRTLITGG